MLGHGEVVKLLLEYGADEQYSFGKITLSAAAENIVKLLLSYGTKVQDSNGKTVLSSAVENIVKLLLDKAADINAQDVADWAASMWASGAEYVEKAKQFLGMGADEQDNKEKTILSSEAEQSSMAGETQDKKTESNQEKAEDKPFYMRMWEKKMKEKEGKE